MSSVVVLVGNPRPLSRTRTLAEAVAGTLAPSWTTIELAEAVGVSFGPSPATGQPVHDAVRAAKLLVVATPTYKGSYTGLLKIFLDQYGHRELSGIVAVPVAIAATPAHQQSVSAALLALLGELGAAVPVEPLSVLESELSNVDLVPAWAARNAPLAQSALVTPPPPRRS